jgi:hypothetical protein
MVGTTMHKHAFRQQVFPVVQNTGKHGIKISNRLYAPTKPQTDIGPMATISMEILIYTEQPWQF